MDFNKLADLIFPNITKTPEDYELIFPKRSLPPQAKVTRLGPSPTGFIHLGNLYGAFADERLAHQSGGAFFLRIEDTDEKRQVEGAVETIINSLNFFGITFDEGAGLAEDTGDYGPYYQSRRGEIYACYAKQLVKAGRAYPCFLTEDEINDIRKQQEAAKEETGIYGRWAACRDLTYDEVAAKMKVGAPFVVRLRSGGGRGDAAKTITVADGIRGSLSMPENFFDIVLIKTSGLPTYHFAHVVDDHLMGTTHVVRGAEWISSVPVHKELFDLLGFDMPVYCHTAQLMKLDAAGNKRKLSKREDPELSLDYYRRRGYHPLAVREYMLTLLNSNFEEWRAANPDASVESFPFSMEKMGTSGALFDLDKLNDVSKDVLAGITAPELYDFLLDWARAFRPELAPALSGSDGSSSEKRAYVIRILDLGRTGERPRKDFVCAEQMFSFISYFFDEHFDRKAADPMPANVSASDVPKLLAAYIDAYDHSDSQEDWFGKVRSLAETMGYAAKPKDYKKNPDLYKGHVGDVSTVIRIALTGRAQSPDIWEIQQIMGEEAVRRRIAGAFA